MSDQEFPPCRVCGERHVVGGLLQCRDGLAERVARQDAALAAEVAAHGLTKAALAVEHTARCTAQTDLADEVEKHAETKAENKALRKVAGHLCIVDTNRGPLVGVIVKHGLTLCADRDGHSKFSPHEIQEIADDLAAAEAAKEKP